jgi:hypothetical protein
MIVVGAYLWPLRRDPFVSVVHVPANEVQRADEVQYAISSLLQANSNAAFTAA